MGDSSHLERMGRELKCPICLSLLNSAISLTCNHMFCNSCIMKSMKSGSNCPVCKVPYGRREVRAAPHMDNLVSIYKGMEAASGINIFVTQNAPSTKLSDEEQKPEGGQDCKGQKADSNSQERANKQRNMKWKRSKRLFRTKQDESGSNPEKASFLGKMKGKRSKRLFKTKQDESGSNPAKPSFPGKKRIQVPQYPLSETPTRSAKFDSALSEMGRDELKTNSIALNGKPALNDSKEPVFSPFFWLREEEEVENSSQQMDGDHAMSASLPTVPSFSDMKDSDDEIPSEMTPNGKVDNQSNVVDLFDSEMFEWTQRACSPELCSSPVKMQVPESDDFDAFQKIKQGPASQGATKGEPRTENMNGINCKEATGSRAMGLLAMSSSEIKDPNGQPGIRKSKKRGRRASKRVQKKFVRKGADGVLGVHMESPKVAEDFIPAQDCGNDGAFSNLKKITQKDCEKVGFDNNATVALENACIEAKSLNQDGENLVTELSASSDKNSLNQYDENMVSELPASLDKKHDNENFSLKKKGRCNKINKQCKKGHSVKSKNWKLESAKDDMLEVAAAINQNRRNDDMSSHPPLASLPLVDYGKASNFGEKASKKARVSSKVDLDCDKKLRCLKRLKVLTDDISRYGLVNDVQGDHVEVSEENTEPINNAQCNPEVSVVDDSSKAEKVLSASREGVLLKCNTISNQFSCSFCHSAEESEASGEMVHYLNGRPIAADYNGGSSIIHSHRNCTEWAPNVYFEDDIAVNLKAELARSRRITCCCCGIKGAALGCYEKSCRKSFHFPCAKLTPQCRLDADNFVMLCPLHASSKLPNEISELPSKTRKKCNPKGQLHNQKSQAVVKHDISTGQQRKSWGSPGKLVLCCSALTVTEKEIVSEFERLSGVTVLKKWGPGITHVIASTDENGACRRTLKFLMGILEGKWILSIEWVKACMKVKECVAEEQYEINIDIHGIRDGPRLGRLRLLNEQPKLFNGFKFYFFGDFMPSYKGYLQDLVVAAGGIVLHRKPISGNQETLLSGSSMHETFIIYSLELPDNYCPERKNQVFNCRRSEAEALARSTEARVASNSWFLNSIAACKVQNVAE